MKKVFFAEEGNSETNLYKVRWIEAEAALCSTKCELMLDKKMDEIKCFKQPSTGKEPSRSLLVIVIIMCFFLYVCNKITFVQQLLSCQQSPKNLQAREKLLL